MQRWRARQATPKGRQISPSGPVRACQFAAADQSISAKNETPGQCPGVFSSALNLQARCPLMAKSGHWLVLQMSAFGGNADMLRHLDTVTSRSDDKGPLANIDFARE